MITQRILRKAKWLAMLLIVTSAVMVAMEVPEFMVVGALTLLAWIGLRTNPADLDHWAYATLVLAVSVMALIVIFD